MLMSEEIAKMIEEMLELQNGTADIQRNELAGKIGCAPSQINYVISSRFNQTRGYMVESRRGTGGYIRIQKVQMNKSSYLSFILSSVRESLSYSELRIFLIDFLKKGIVSEKEANTYAQILSDSTLILWGREEASKIRAVIFRTLILNMIQNL